jgi:prepilin-type processing-associated H-X9-DG protein
MKKKFSSAFTLIELLVVIATIIILAAIATPVFTGILERAKATKDMSNLRQLGIGMQTYLNDKDQILPASVTWPGTIAAPALYPKYASSRRVFQSPFDPRPPSESDTTPASVPISYSINTNMYLTTGLNGNMSRVVSPTSTILMAPNYPSSSGNPAVAGSWPGNATNAPDLPLGGGGETRGTHSAGTKINVLFCDGHTETLTFGPAGTAGTFQDTTSPPLGLKHWDPLQ